MTVKRRALFPDLCVNGEVVAQTAVAAEAQNHAAPAGKPGIAWRKAANALMMRTLLLQEARRRGLVAKPAQIGPNRHENEEDALIRVLLEQAIVAERPSENEIRAEWARDPSRFRSPPLREVSHILVACDPRAVGERNAARSRAISLNTQAIANPHDFGRLAAEHSDCGSAASGGALGQLRPGDCVPEFEAAVCVLRAGEITTEPILTRHGWHVIRLDAAEEGTTLPYAVAKKTVSAALKKAAWTRAARNFAIALVEQSEISGAGSMLA